MTRTAMIPRIALAFGIAVTALHLATVHAAAQVTKEAAGVAIESNVVYGMHSGTALLLNIHRPIHPNGKGLIIIPGSGWHAAAGYGATALKDSRPPDFWSALTDAGYTLFIINHRGSPQYHYPDAERDAQRAVQFVRHNAQRFGIDPSRLGALGHSSGGHLVSLLGTLEGKGDPVDQDPVNRESARVQAVIAGAPPIDLTLFDTPSTQQMAADFMGQPASARELYRQASPATHVTAQSAPFLLVHGDADDVVPIGNSELMARALQKAGVEVEFMRLPGAGHADFPVRLAVPWLDRHLLADR